MVIGIDIAKQPTPDHLQWVNSEFDQQVLYQTKFCRFQINIDLQHDPFYD